MRGQDKNTNFKWMKKNLISFYSLIIIIYFTFDVCAQTTGNNHLSLAGFRASRITSSFPDNVFPDDNYWVHVGNGMSNKLNLSVPSSIWIVSLYQNNGITRLGFPVQKDSASKILGADYDQNENYLTRFDKEGFKIFLQIEPGSASIDTLIDMVLKRYGHHSCVTGFGIDIEWYEADKYKDGRKVSDSAAAAWEAKVKSFNKNYTLFLKHFNPEWMPKNYRGNIIFINDGQQFGSLNELKNDFINWSNYFPNNKVGFQYGYPADEIWWQKLNDPAKTIGEELISSVPNIYSLYWVDFSVTKIFPMNVTGINDLNTSVNNFSLLQNYPNPFNPTTTIQYSIPKNSFVKIILYDVLGKVVKTLVNEEKTTGNYSVNFNAARLSSGIYFYRLQAGNFVNTKKMILLR